MIASHDRVGRQRREAERRLVGDEHLGRIGQRGARLSICCSPPDRRPAVSFRRSLQDHEALVRLGAQLVGAQQHGEVLLHREPRKDPASLGYEQHPVARPPERLPRGDVVAVEVHGPDRDRDRTRQRRCRASTSRRRWLRAGRRPCRASTRDRRRAAPRRRRSRPRHRACTKARIRRNRGPGRTIPDHGRRRGHGSRGVVRGRGAPRRAVRASAASICASRRFSRCLRSFFWPVSARTPSGSTASWIAPMPEQDRHEDTPT